MNSPASAPEGISEVWHEYWRSHQGQIGSSAPDFLRQSLVSACGNLRGKLALEAGSGTGGLCLALAGEGARVCALDIVPQCLKGAASLRWRVAGDLFRLPFPQASFDVVFNSGVMEHFEPPDLERGLAEMVRVLRPGGRLVVIVPSARGRFYLQGKRRLEASGRWEYGNEYPVATLKPYMTRLGLTGGSEKLAGVRWQARFLDGWRRALAATLLRPFGENSRVGAALFGAYLLVSAWTKP